MKKNSISTQPRQIIVDGKKYWYSDKTGTLFFDSEGRKHCPIAVFNDTQYKEFLNQISDTQPTTQAAQDDFNELLVDKQTDNVIQPGTPEYREAFYELYGRYPGDKSEGQPAQGGDKELITPGEWAYDDGHIFTTEAGREWTSIAHIYDIYDNNGKAECNWKLLVDAPRLQAENKELREIMQSVAKRLRAFHDEGELNDQDKEIIKDLKNSLSEIIEANQ